MKLALVQMAMAEGLPENLERSVASIAQAAQAGADLVLFPELQLSPFFPQYEHGEVGRYRLELGDEPIVRLSEACRKYGIAASPNVYLREGGRDYDASLFIDSLGQILGVSKMVHIMQGRHFYEQDYYAPSDDGFKVYNTSLGRIGVVICFDRHLPESVRTCVARGADLILIPTANVLGEPLEMFAWEVRVQAMQSCVSIAMCNRVGSEDQMTFVGQSLVADAEGGVIAQADGAAQILYAEVDFDKNRSSRAARPYFGLRRPELYL